MGPNPELSFDRFPLMDHRNLLRLLAGAGVVSLVSCASSSRSASSGSRTTIAKVDFSGSSTTTAGSVSSPRPPGA